MIEIAMGILREDPAEKQQIAAARGWAVDLIDHYAAKKFDDVAKAELKAYALSSGYGWGQPAEKFIWVPTYSDEKFKTIIDEMIKKAAEDAEIQPKTTE